MNLKVMYWGLRMKNLIEERIFAERVEVKHLDAVASC